MNETRKGRKDNKGKPCVVQGVFNYFPRALVAVAEQSEFGRRKYSLSYADKNFLRVDNAKAAYQDAVGRHILKGAIDEGGIDPDSKLPHSYAIAWCALAALEIELIDREEAPSSRASDRTVTQQQPHAWYMGCRTEDKDELECDVSRLKVANIEMEVDMKNVHRVYSELEDKYAELKETLPIVLFLWSFVSAAVTWFIAN